MNLLRALAAVSSLTMVSRVLGYARDFFIARLFGAGLFVLLIPNAINHALLYLLAIAAGSLVTGLIYAFIKRGETQGLAVAAGAA